MQPIDPNKAPKVREPQFNYLGLWIDNLAGAVEWLSATGMRFTPKHPQRCGRFRCLLPPSQGQRCHAAVRRRRADRIDPSAAGSDRGVRQGRVGAGKIPRRVQVKGKIAALTLEIGLII